MSVFSAAVAAIIMGGVAWWTFTKVGRSHGSAITGGKSDKEGGKK